VIRPNIFYRTQFSLCKRTIGTAIAMTSLAIPNVAISNVAIASPREVAQTAKQVTVRLMGDRSTGSGAIIAHQDNTYSVLTCAHVAMAMGEDLEIRTPDGEEYEIDKISTADGDINLAVVSFSSDRSYAIAAMGNSDRLAEGDSVYVAGYPLPAGDRDRDLNEFQFTDGMISSRLNPLREGGYGFTHTSLTYTGMGGAPMFDETGQLIGVHCGGDRDSQNPALKTGFNWGIPINSLVPMAQEMGLSLGNSIVRSTPNVLPEQPAIAPAVPSSSSPFPRAIDSSPSENRGIW
jgi:serine protease Do